jgi:hypothetical protein
MSSWRQRRKFTYLASVLIVLAIVIIVPSYFHFYKAPTCFDKTQNQGEEGIDCGGPCSTVCSFSAIDPIIRWARAFPIIPGTYSAVAYIENPNTNASVSQIAYNFKFYDDNNILLSERSGTTFIPVKKAFPIFETMIPTGVRQIKKTFFQFTEIPNWRSDAGTVPEIMTQSKNLTNENIAPRLSATIYNGNITAVNNITVIAILYDKNDNAIGSSQTYIESLSKESSTEAIFTWPAPFSAPVSRIEIYPRVAQAL